jgi:hypothetical protein
VLYTWTGYKREVWGLFDPYSKVSGLAALVVGVAGFITLNSLAIYGWLNWSL